MKRLALLVLLVGCSDPLKHDVELFCNATVGTSFKTFAEVGPYVAEKAKSDELKALLLKPIRGEMDVWMFAAAFRELMQKTGTETCKTLDVIVPPLRDVPPN